jgi:hypothetical protein
MFGSPAADLNRLGKGRFHFVYRAGLTGHAGIHVMVRLSHVLSSVGSGT